MPFLATCEDTREAAQYLIKVEDFADLRMDQQDAEYLLVINQGRGKNKNGRIPL